MDDKDIFEEPFAEETGASTGDHRENDARAPGFTSEQDRFWRSHFQLANRLADQGYEQARPAYELGHAAAADARYRGRPFDEIEIALEQGWLNVRAGGGEWQAVREYARHAYEAAHTGYLRDVSALGGTASHDRPSFADPVAGGVDPTSPESEEQTLALQRNDDAPSNWALGDQGAFGEKRATEEDSSRPPESPR